MNKEILKKFFNSPGLCSYDELVEVEKFLNEYKKLSDIYKEVVGHGPLGLTLDKNLDDVKWYIDFVIKRGEKN